MNIKVLGVYKYYDYIRSGYGMYDNKLVYFIEKPDVYDIQLPIVLFWNKFNFAITYNNNININDIEDLPYEIKVEISKFDEDTYSKNNLIYTDNFQLYIEKYDYYIEIDKRVNYIIYEIPENEINDKNIYTLNKNWNIVGECHEQDIIKTINFLEKSFYKNTMK